MSHKYSKNIKYEGETYTLHHQKTIIESYKHHKEKTLENVIAHHGWITDKKNQPVIDHVIIKGVLDTTL